MLLEDYEITLVNWDPRKIATFIRVFRQGKIKILLKVAVEMINFTRIAIPSSNLSILGTKFDEHKYMSIYA